MRLSDPPADSLPRHGGDLAFATRQYGALDEGWLDLSTGINPHPYPIDPKTVLTDLAHLPGLAGLDELIATARGAWSAPPEVAITAVPGTEIVIRLLPFLIAEGPVTVIGPTYGSHAHAWRAAGRQVAETPWPARSIAGSRAVVLCNPNNPDGRLIPVSDLRAFVAAQTRAGVTTIVDEAFVDLHPDQSLIPCIGDLDVVVLRSFGKFYGLAGLRLGFAAGPREHLDRLDGLLGDWPVSSPAIRIGRKALADRTWQDQTRARLAEAAARLRAMLTRRGLPIAGGTDLFVLIQDENAHAVHRELACRGIWTRIFDYRGDWLRVGVPGDQAGFERLDAALAAIRAPTGE